MAIYEAENNFSGESESAGILKKKKKKRQKLFIVAKSHNVEHTILTIFNCRVQWH